MTRGLESPWTESIDHDGHARPTRRDGVRAIAGVGPRGARGATCSSREWEAVPLRAPFGALDVARSVFRIRGMARIGVAERPWSLVLKVLGPAAGPDDPTHIDYWKRELLLYSSGLLDDLPAGLRAPRCYGCDEPMDGVGWLWLEHVREDRERAWPLGRWTLLARHLGRFNGTYLAGRSLPRTPWLSGQRLRTLSERHHSLVAQIATAPDNPEVRRWWPPQVVAAILLLWEERDAFCDALERLPQTFCHGDAIRRNILSGSEETVAIDNRHVRLRYSWLVGLKPGRAQK